MAWIEAQLRRRGVDPARPTLEALAVHDQLHSGGLEGTRAFLEWVTPTPGCRVLDLGAGLGGTARLLARDFGCRVLALEPSLPLLETGAALTARVGLEDLVDHVAGDGESFRGSEGFDLVLVQHVDMHVEDKAKLYRTCAEHLNRDGRVAWHDWLAGPGGAPIYPTPWSRGGEGSWLSDAAEFNEGLIQAGLGERTVEERSEATRGWFCSSVDALTRALERPPSEDPALRSRRAELERLLDASQNVLRSIRERRLIPFFGKARLV